METSEVVVTVEEVSYTVYENMEILPMQTPEIDSDHEPFPFVMNEEFYEGTASYPQKWAYIDGGGGWSGLNAARLVVNPQPNPVTTGASLGFTVPSGGNVRLNVYDVSGRIVEAVFN